jgi:hypothetical protein
MLAELDLLHRHHFRRLISFASGLNRFTPNMSNAECENAFCPASDESVPRQLLSPAIRNAFAERIPEEPLESSKVCSPIRR